MCGCLVTVTNRFTINSLNPQKNAGEILSKKDSIISELATLKETQEKKLYQNKKNKYIKINMIKHLIKGELSYSEKGKVRANNC